MSRWRVTCDAINPHVKPVDEANRWETGFLGSHIQHMYDNSDEKSLWRMKLVEEVLADGTIYIYQGWSRPDKEDSFVYVGLPDRDYKSGQIILPPQPGRVFCVFVCHEGTIDHWAWRGSDESNQPKDISGDLIWSRNHK